MLELVVLVERGTYDAASRRAKEIAVKFGKSTSTTRTSSGWAVLVSPSVIRELKPATPPEDPEKGKIDMTRAGITVPPGKRIPHDSESTLDVFALLQQADQKERQTLAKILSGEDRTNWSAAKLTEELCDAGGHSVANMFRGHGVSYTEIVNDVYVKLEILERKPNDYSETETAIVAHLFAKIVDAMTPEQKADFERDLTKIAEAHGESYTGLVGAGGSLVIAGAAGFAPYLMATSALSALTGALGITVPFVAYTGLTSTLGVVLGPVGWIGLAAYGTYTLGQPNFKKTIPSVALIYAIRSRLEAEGR